MIFSEVIVVYTATKIKNPNSKVTEENSQEEDRITTRGIREL